MSNDGTGDLADALREARAIVSRTSARGDEANIRDAVVAEIDAAFTKLLPSSSGAAPKKDLLSVVCHDLKDPLASIVMGAGFLRKVLPDDEASASARRVVEAIQRSADRMNQLVLDFYDLGKMERGQLTIEKRPADVAAIVRAACDAATASARAKEVTLVAEPVDGVPSIMLDRARVLQVLAKVIGNAIKFTPKGGTVSVGAAPKDGGVELHVRDTGKGIAPERVGSVFDRDANMRQTPRDGPGLGLPIARGFVTLHGGRIEAESSVGAGTTIRFWLPAA